MRKILGLVLLLGFIGFGSISALSDSFLFMPGISTALTVPNDDFTLGLSVKTVEASGSTIIQPASWEVGYMYSPLYDAHSVDVIGPTFLGFLSPGISVSSTSTLTRFMAVLELDTFYFPFAFFMFAISERPPVIPSVYVRFKSDFTDLRADIGVRLSIPLYPR